MTATAFPSHPPRPASAQHGELPPLTPPRLDDQVASQPVPDLRRVAVIEDSAIHFEVLEQHLRAHYPSLQAVEWISDATAVLDRVAACAPDLVITDCLMPGYDVLTTLGLLRQRWPSLPVLVMSGRVGEESVVQLLKAGASDFLPKARLERLPLVIDRELVEAQAKQAQARLQRQLERQRLINQAIIDQVPVGLWMKSADGSIEHVNQRGADLMASLGAPRNGGFRGLEGRWVDTGQPIELHEWPGSRALEQHVAVAPRLVELRDKAGGQRFLSCSALPLAHADSGLIGAVVTALDLTAEIELQERLRLAEARLRQLSMNQSEWHERQMARLSRELHDNLGQVLSLLKLHLGTAARPDSSPERRAAEIDAALPLVDMTLSRLREVCGDLWPSELRDFGLGPALAGVCSAAARAGGITVSFDEAGPPRTLSSSSLLGLFRVGQQAVTNALRHADAATVQLQLCWSETAVALQVCDDGIGFDVHAPGLPSQHGLRGMRERMELLGGSFHVESRPGLGTTARAQVPVPEGEDA